MLKAFLCVCVFVLGGVALRASAAEPVTVVPRGEVLKRIEMARNRMLNGDIPRFTESFILADVALWPEYPRRFSEYSGDLSGRYIGALATMPAGDAMKRVKEIVRRAIEFQKADGRFGSDALKFTPEEIGMNQMALLWGNGRLLVGLIEYYDATHDEAALASAKKLGDFLLNVREGCSNPAVAEHVKDLAAAGMICFTQLVEGLVMLHRVTDDARYLDASEAIVPWLDRERRAQHSHGYLSSLRGFLMLYEATKKAEYLNLVEETYASLVGSPDYTVYGGVQELFGQKTETDEGCSEADFVRLSLDLWRVTRKMDYLERGERCMLNQFFGNQFSTGDFGHHIHFSHGIQASRGVGRAWWCCTMHGLRAFKDILDAVASVDGDTVRINLFLDAVWSDGTRAFTFERGPSPYAFVARVDKAPENGVSLAVRKPGWAERMTVTANGKPIDTTESDGYVMPSRRLKPGERVEVEFVYQARLLTRDGQTLGLDQVTDKPVEAALYYGPWLLGVDEADNPMFFGEPWMGNEIYLPDKLKGAQGSPHLLSLPCAQLVCEYVHGGFPEKLSVTLRPFSEYSLHEPTAFGVWLKYRR